MTSRDAVSAETQPHTTQRNYWIFFLISLVIFIMMLIFRTNGSGYRCRLCLLF